MWQGHDGMGWWMLFGSALWLVFLVSVVSLVARFLTSHVRSHDFELRTPVSNREPLDIARLRYADGELSRAEFLRLADDLLRGREDGGPSRAPDVGDSPTLG